MDWLQKTYMQLIERAIANGDNDKARELARNLSEYTDHYKA